MNSISVYKIIKNLIFTLLGILLVLLVLFILNKTVDNNVIFPKISVILKRFFKLLGNKNTYKYFGVSFIELIIALLFASVFGITLGTLGGLRHEFDLVLKPIMTILKSTPMIIIIVIVMLTTPNDDLSFKDVPKVCAFLILLPLMYESIKTGISSIDKRYIEEYKMFSNTNLNVLFRVHYPLIGPYFKEAYSNSISMGFKLIITTEYVVQVKDSLGIDIFNKFRDVEYDYLYAYALILAIFVTMLEFIPKLISILIQKLLQK
ncbi:MAG: ABC transporter permease subunit [Acholeplasmatales bacterium]|nr:ABC transporter permease subunit [Acholeplasmatales bacterium]